MSSMRIARYLSKSLLSKLLSAVLEVFPGVPPPHRDPKVSLTVSSLALRAFSQLVIHSSSRRGDSASYYEIQELMET
jgi:hypothetical protein